MILIDFNNTEKDIMWKEAIEEMQEIHPHRFQFTHVLSNASLSWTGRHGRVSQELLKEILPEQLKKPLFTICGPLQFTKLTQQFLNSLGFSENAIHAFLG